MICQAERLSESRILLVLLQHGLKAPIKGPDGSWVVVTEPDEIGPVIEKSGNLLPNLGAVLAPKSDSHLVVVDIDGSGAFDRLRELGVSSAWANWIAKTGRGNWHIYYWGNSTEPPPTRAVHAAKLPVDLLPRRFGNVC